MIVSLKQKPVKEIYEELRSKGPELLWDFKEAPYLFPIHLFLLFQEKYNVERKTHKCHVDFFDMDIVACKVHQWPLPNGYEAWISIRRVWETAFTFIFSIGNDISQNIILAGKQVHVGIAVHEFHGKSALKVEPSCKVQVDNDSLKFFAIQGAMSLIVEEMKKANLKRTEGDF